MEVIKMTKAFNKVSVVFLGDIICNEQVDELHNGFVCRGNFRVLDKYLCDIAKYITKIEVYGNGYLVHFINGAIELFCTE